MKKIIVSVLLLSLMVSLTSCNTNNLAEYKKALEKTNQITSGQMSAEFSMSIDFETEGMTADEIKNLNYYKDMKGSIGSVFDSETDRLILRNYINFGGMGFDYDMYYDGVEMVMKLPVVGKYIKLNEMMDLSYVEEEPGSKIISDDTMKLIGEKWVSLMNEDDVFKGKDIILTTPDGEVKTTEYSITLKSEQIRSLILEGSQLLANDKSLEKFYEEYKGRDNSKSFEEIIGLIKDNVEDYDVENFKYTALVDIDGYIVSESIIFSIKSNGASDLFKGADYNLNIKNWNINKEQSFEFPALTDKNTLKVDEMGEMPDIMKSLFKNE